VAPSGATFFLRLRRIANTQHSPPPAAVAPFGGPRPRDGAGRLSPPSRRFQAALQAGIERVPQPVADEIDHEHHDQDGRALQRTYLLRLMREFPIRIPPPPRPWRRNNGAVAAAPAAFRVRVWQITSWGRDHGGATDAGGGECWLPSPNRCPSGHGHGRDRRCRRRSRPNAGDERTRRSCGSGGWAS
jgi:hypothetical protein